jgi:copper transport protein
MRLIAGLATWLSVVCFATGALAHAELVSVEPADGSMMAQLPEAIRLRFNEPVTPAVVRLIDAEGNARDDITVNARDDTIEVKLPNDLPRGTQLLSYRVISADGHPVGGSTVFSLGVSTANRGALSPSDRAAGLAILIWLARIGVYLGLFAGVGGAFFGAWIARGRAGSTLTATALTIGLLGALASLGLQGLDVLGLPLSDVLTSVAWRAALATSLGPSLLIAIAALAAGFLAQRNASAGLARVLSGVAMVAVGVSLASSGHAAAAPPQWLSRPMVFLHGMGVAFWVGALMPLLAMAWRPAGGLLAVINRFSRVALPVVAVLVLAGLGLAIIQLEGFRSLIETRYGIILSIKLLLVVALLGLAALNRFRLAPMLARDPLNARPLVRSILAECAVVAVILAVVAGWRFTPPPRALAAAVQAPLALHIHSEKTMFQVLVSPAEVGSDNFVLQLMNGDASPLAAREATLILSLPERGIEPFERKAVLGADGYWHLRDVPLPFSGHWHLRIDALVTDFEKVSMEDDFDVPAH